MKVLGIGLIDPRSNQTGSAIDGSVHQYVSGEVTAVVAGRRLLVREKELDRINHFLVEEKLQVITRAASVYLRYLRIIIKGL